MTITQPLLNLSWYTAIIKKSIRTELFSADIIKHRQSLRESQQWLNSWATGKRIGIVLLENAVLAVVAVLETKAALAGTAVFVRSTTVIRILLTMEAEAVAATSVEVLFMVIVIAMKQAVSKVEAAVRRKIVMKVE